MPDSPPTQSYRHALVTGGCGFIGHHLVARLLGHGASVTVLDDLSTGRRENLPEHRDLEWIEGSVLEPVAVERASRGAEVIFHLASMVGMRRVVSAPRESFRISTEGTRNLLAASGTTPVVALSSSSVYGLQSHGRVAERDVEHGEPALTYDGGEPGYATGKWKMEKRVLAARDDRPVLVLRPFNVIGEGQSGSYGMVVPRFLAQARAGEPLSIYGDGSQQRTFCCVHGFVDRLLSLAGLPAAWRAAHPVFNVGCDQPTAIGDLARIVLEETGSSSTVRRVRYDEVYPGRRDVQSRSPSLERIDRLLGPRPWPGIRTVIRRLVAAGEPGGAQREACA